MAENENKEESLWPTIRLGLFIGIGILVIGAAYMYNQQKTEEFQIKARECQAQCKEKGSNGAEFRGTALTGAECKCL